jgi:hypothetical protein
MKKSVSFRQCEYPVACTATTIHTAIARMSSRKLIRAVVCVMEIRQTKKNVCPINALDGFMRVATKDFV